MNTQPQVVLVVEDEWIIRETAMEVLKEAGFLVLDAADGAGGLAVIAEHRSPVHALFTDVRMPGSIDGIELARRARALVPDIAILVASGRAVPNAAELPPGSQFLSKPYSFRDIPGFVRALLSEPMEKGMRPPILVRCPTWGSGSNGTETAVRPSEKAQSADWRLRSS